MRAILGLATIILCAPCVQAASPVYPELSLSISPGEISLAASPNYQEFRFNGTAALDNPSGLPVTVSLFSRVTEAWHSSCTPNLMNHYSSETFPFNLTIRVNPGVCNKTALAWVDGEVRFNGAIVSTNQSQRSTIRLGDLPGYTTSQNPDSSWPASAFGGNFAFSPATAILVLIVVILAAVTYGLVRRRRRRKGAQT